MNSTMLKIIELCERVLQSYQVYSLEVHMAKNISCKIERRIKLTKNDLDFITKWQMKYGI